LAKLEEYEQAIANYDQAIQIKPDFYQAWTNRGNALSDLGEKEEAIANYQQAIQIKSDFHDAWNNRGVALAELREYEQAIANYQQAIQIKSDFHDAWHNRGVALFRLGEYEQAIASFDQAIQIKPDLHASWINRGIVLGNSWNYNPEAAAVVPLQCPHVSPIVSNPIETQCGYQGELLSYQQGLNYCPQNTHPEGWGRLHQAIGNAHYQEGKYQQNYQDYWQKAVTEYHQALITLTPDTYPEWHLEVLQNLIRILWGLNQDTAAQEWQNRGLTVFQTLLTKKSPFQKGKLMAKFIRFSKDAGRCLNPRTSVKKPGFFG
jgi:tetratricopeptide (TPR) repeat protein